MTLWQVFRTAASRHADRTAIEVQRLDRVDSWTYRRLFDAALARASGLIARGVAAGDRCAILADNDADWCAAYLGILRVGAVAVPLDTNYSAAQVATIVKDATPRAIIANRRLMATAREGVKDRAGIDLLDVHEMPEQGAADLPPEGDAAGEPAVILYTSGTTADPKGVVLSHANLIAERDAAFEIVTVTDRDSVLGVLPLFHALAQLANLALPLAVGARVVFLETVNSTELVRALSERQITIFACVPQFFYLIHQRVMKEVSRSGMLKRALFRAMLALCFRLRRLGVNLGPRLFARVHAIMGRQMRLFVTGGSKFDPAIGRDLYSLGFTILQAYGLTETSGAATINNADEAHIDTVGRALPGQQIKTLPAEDAELDGEIAVRGPIVMQGYYNRPDATAAVMKDGWFLTGDLGRLDSSGRLTITGRKKEIIVLVSGKNIYPEEVEAAYRKSQYVKEICVMGLTRDDDPTTERLYAAVVPDTDLMKARKIVNAGDLLRFELEGQSIHLPPHKRVLGYDVWFEPLPRTTTGKLKRHEIERRTRQKARESARAAATPAVDPAWAADDHAQAAVAVIAGRAKGAALTSGSNLELDLGLDSMERVELITELEQVFGVQVGEEQAPQILTVGQLIDAVRPGAGGAEAGVAGNSWAVMLADLPPATDPVLGGLLERRIWSAALLFACTRLLRLVLPQVTVEGLSQLPRKGPYIVCPNHQGYLDPFIVCSVLPFAVFRQLFFVGAAEYFETALSRWIARQANCVPVDPDANLVPAMKAGAFGLQHGKVLMLFPEGERSIDGRVKRFKKGAPILAQHLNVPIVPMAIAGAYEVWPRNRRINWRTLVPWNGHRIRLSVGPPMMVDRSMEYAAAAAALQDTVEKMWLSLSEKQRPHRQARRDAPGDQQA
ncbi:MAG: AMP-binding protein [Acidobacteriota bacterium]